MKIFFAFTLLVIVLATLFHSSEAKPGWLKDRLKGVEKSVRRVRDRLAENQQLVQDYVGIAGQVGILKNGK